jgi:CrcB protein
MRLVLVLAGGGLGSAARYLVGIWAAERWGSSFPWGTLTVNLLGCFLIGLLATLADDVRSIGPDARVFLVVGVLGGFTTFSSFSLDALRLGERDELLRAVVYVGASVGAGLVAATVGIAAGRSLMR